MNRTSGAALAAALLCAGCPLPQPLPDVPGGTIRPPQIMTERIRINGAPQPLSVIPVPSDCGGAAPSFVFDVVLYDPVALGSTARWFVDYLPVQNSSDPILEEGVPAPADTELLEVAVDPFTFLPYAGSSRTPGTVRLVELVVSTRFADPPEDDRALPWKTPADRFETQTYRWVFRFEAGTAGCP